MDLQSYFPKVDEAASWLQKKNILKPKIAIVLSGGLSAFLEGLEEKIVIPSKDIPHFPVTRAEGHLAALVFGKYKGVPLVALSGRCHYYEGYSPQEIVFPYFVFEKIGAKFLITTNAVGGINRNFKPGNIMLVTDHINMMGINPLIGLAIQRKTNQFTNMTKAYDEGLQRLAKKVAKHLDCELKEGVYLASSGPSYETKAEVTAFRHMGADAVGMSTVPEVIAANFLNLKVLSFSCIANPASDLHPGKMSHSEVLAAMNEVAPKVVKLLYAVVEGIG